MWELIRANKRNSIILMVLMASVLLLLGYIIGAVFSGNSYGGYTGLMVATGVWLVLTLISFAGGDQIFLAASGAKPITHDVHPQLFNVVEEMKIAAGLPAMPKIYIINDPAPNAFATGRSPQTASVAVTAGLLARLNRDELQGVVAHEISHIVHRDILFVTLAGVMLGSIVLLSQAFMRGMYYGSFGGSRRRYSSGGKGGGQAQLVMLVIAILAAILAPIMAQLLYFALSRRREYLADAGAARLTRYPEGLASALEKIANDPSPQLASANKASAPMYIVNPFKKAGQMRLSDLTSTHPPISERIKILRNLQQGASFKEYSKAFSEVTHRKSVVPAAALKDEEVKLRQSQAGEEKEQHFQSQMRQVGDIMRRVNQFVFLTCACGLKLKIPPNYKSNEVICPRCNRKLDIPAR
jgi:heat shock protein HtpX